MMNWLCGSQGDGVEQTMGIHRGCNYNNLGPWDSGKGSCAAKGKAAGFRDRHHKYNEYSGIIKKTCAIQVMN